MSNTIGNLFKGDKGIWMVFFFLCIVSIVEVYSASTMLTYKGGSYITPILKHIFLLGLGLTAMVVTANINCGYFKFMTPFILGGAILLLLVVLAIGTATNGAQRWINIGPIQFQPSELAKGALILSTAQILSSLQTENGADPRAFRYILGVCGCIIPFIMVENLSTAALLCAVILMMMFIGRVPMRQIGKLLGAVVILGAFMLSMIMMFGHVEEKQKTDKQNLTEQVQTESKEKKEKGAIGKVFHRFDTWKGRIDKFLDSKELTPKDVDLDEDAQESYAKVAIATSNVVGKGPGNSDQCDFISQAFSDFIYAIIIEEMGIEGAFGVAMLYIILLFRTGRIANRCETSFPAFLAMGLALLLVTQALFNMMVAVGMVPVTGQPLPLISRGGTSTITNCIYIGVILSISRSAKRKQELVVEPMPQNGDATLSATVSTTADSDRADKADNAAE